MDRLTGRTALVTGAAGGIGAATARRLASEGAAVLATDVQDEAGALVAAEINAAGGRCAYRHLDVTSEPQWAAAVAAAVADFGGLDILVNNAGVADYGTIDDCTLELWNETIQIDQTGVFLGMRAASAALAASGHGSVVNISSIFGTIGGFGTSPAYHAAKGAVRTMTKNVALLWADRGIRVNSVHPGFVDTAMIGQARGTPAEQAILAMTPMGRWASRPRWPPASRTWPATTRHSSPAWSFTSTAATWPASRHRGGQARPAAWSLSRMPETAAHMASPRESPYACRSWLKNASQAMAR